MIFLALNPLLLPHTVHILSYQNTNYMFLLDGDFLTDK